jgi:uncharacterized radical SAM superfamily protein
MQEKGISRNPARRKINFFFTSHLFPSISVTGQVCALMCKHCKGKLLESLIPATTCGELLKKADILYWKGAKGILLTGGCDEFGSVPIKTFVPAIKAIKDKTNLILIAHTGFVSCEDAKELKESGLDGIGFDVIGDMSTAREIYGLEVTEKEYLENLLAIESSGLTIFPHVCVGLHFGKMKGEFRALELIKTIHPSTIIITGLMPVPGTPMARMKPEPSDFAKVIKKAIEMFPSTPVVLGCAHSSGNDRGEIEKIAIECGAAGIATPALQTIEYARDKGFEINYYGTCCGLIPDEKTRIDSLPR